MKTMLLLFTLSLPLMGQVTADEIMRCEIVTDSVVFEGLAANPEHHVRKLFLVFSYLEDHAWKYTITGTIPSEYFLADDYKGERICTFCRRKELIHTVLWSERIK